MDDFLMLIDLKSALFAFAFFVGLVIFILFSYMSSDECKDRSRCLKWIQILVPIFIIVISMAFAYPDKKDIEDFLRKSYLLEK